MHRLTKPHVRQVSFAFTLIELLVVVSIIALLVSILMPALGKARESAKKTMCLSNLKNAYVALEMYAINNNDIAMPVRVCVNDYPRLWVDLISLYIDQDENSILYASAPQIPKNTLIVCPANIMMRTQSTIYAVGYAMNANRGLDWRYCGSDGDNCKVIKQSTIPSPSSKIVLSDSYSFWDSTVSFRTISWFTDLAYPGVNYCVGLNIHKDDGANFLWQDGHSSPEKKQNWRDNWWILKRP